MTGESLNILQDNIEKLKQLFPHIFTEEKIDLEKFKVTFSDKINLSNERYVLNWAGKGDAFRSIQIPTKATLIPIKEESINYSSTQHLFIEGENLEVLKVLQKPYHGKVKCIIIDPPYNTGSDSFIYPDSFKESRAEYEKRVGDKDEEGFLLKQGLYRKNSKDNGHFHSNWLSMMYPRLFLARNLLSEDGVIFIHIDDNEVHNLRILLNEIFGEENFEGHIHWRRRSNQPNDKTKMIGLVAEHILAFSKNKEAFKKAGVGKIDLTGEFSNPDNDERGDWASKPWKVGSDQSGSRYTIVSPTGKVMDEEWMGEEDTYKALVDDRRIIFPKNGDGYPRKKYFRFEREEEGQCATNWWSHTEFGDNQGANNEMTSLFGVKNLFDNPKPKEVARGLIQIANCKSGDIILDFFAGSGTTAQAVLELNEEDKERRKFILVQLPLAIDEDEEAYAYGFRTISELTKERVKRVITKLNDQNSNLFEAGEHDLGFKVFKLASSNFKIWSDVEVNEDNLVEQLDAFTTPQKSDTSELNMLYELMLKAGYKLTDDIEDTGKYYLIKGGELIIALNAINSEIMNEIVGKKPKKVITMDNLFSNNDQLKTNSVLQMNDAQIDFKTI